MQRHRGLEENVSTSPEYHSCSSIAPFLEADGRQWFDGRQRTHISRPLIGFTLAIGCHMGRNRRYFRANTGVRIRKFALPGPRVVTGVGRFAAIERRLMTPARILVLQWTIGFSYASRGWLIEDPILFLNELGLIFATLPTVPPIADKKLEAEGIDLHAGLETDAQIPKVHLILV